MDKDDRYTRITLRIPKDLHSRLSDAADETSKSMNAEIIARLEESFLPAKQEHPEVALERHTLIRELDSLSFEIYQLQAELHHLEHEMAEAEGEMPLNSYVARRNGLRKQLDRFQMIKRDKLMKLKTVEISQSR